MRVSIIIPTLNAGKMLESLLLSLNTQTMKADEIIIIDSSSTDNTVEIASKFPDTKVISIQAASFNHGGTRNMGAKEARGDIVLFMTQDALPSSSILIKRMVYAFEESNSVAAVYARQLPRPEARPREKLVRSFTYPEESSVHDRNTKLGLQTYYLSNVCAAYRKDIYLKLGGFETDIRTNEDMLFAAKAIRAGFQIVYTAEAEVYHSHNLTFSEQYRRNKLQGYELARHRELLGDASPVNAGKKMFNYVTHGLLKQGRILSWSGFCIDCAARYAGNRAGRKEYELERYGSGNGNT